MGLPDPWLERRARLEETRRIRGEGPLRVQGIRDQAGPTPFGDPSGICGAQRGKGAYEQSGMGAPTRTEAALAEPEAQ